MNPDYEEAKKSFIDERLAILEYDSGITWESESVMMKESERCWLKYQHANKIYANEQEKLI
jgi:hypothetical protein